MAGEPEKISAATAGDKPAKKPRRRMPLLALLLGWAVPGLGHVYARDYFRGVLFFALIIGAIATGLYISDTEAIDLTFHEIAFIGQVGAGGPVLGIAALKYSMDSRRVAAENSGKVTREKIRLYREKLFMKDYHNRGHINPWAELGLLLTTIAGLLNVLIALDAAVTAAAVTPARAALKKMEPPAKSPAPPDPEPGQAGEEEEPQ